MKRLLLAVWVVALTLLGGGWLLSSGQREQNARHPVAKPTPVPKPTSRRPIWEFKRFGPPLLAEARRAKSTMPTFTAGTTDNSLSAIGTVAGTSGSNSQIFDPDGALVFNQTGYGTNGDGWGMHQEISSEDPTFIDVPADAVNGDYEARWYDDDVATWRSALFTVTGGVTPNPQIAQGASGSVSQIGFDGTVFDWEVRDSSTAVIGDSTTPNGWDVQDRTSSDCTVFVPVGATIAADYRVVWIGGGTGYYADFDVFAGGAPPGDSSAAGFLSVLRRRG